MYTAPMDPAPTREVFFAGKQYHFTWKRKTKGKMSCIILHRGPAEECTRQHHMMDGTRK